MVTETKVKRCWFCGNTENLEYAGFDAWLGGTGDVPQYKCRDLVACNCRQEAAGDELHKQEQEGK